MYTVLENEQGAPAAVAAFLKKMLEQKVVDAVFVAAKTPYSSLPMPSLFCDPEKLHAAVPLAPAAPFNAARQASSLLRQDAKKKIALVLRPCEIRALVELVKLRQAVLEPAVLIGIECKGRMENAVYREIEEEHPAISLDFYQKDEFQDRICSACKACDRFLPEGVDLVVSVFGTDVSKGAGLFSSSETGEAIIKQIGPGQAAPPVERDAAILDFTRKRSEYKAALLEQTSCTINDMEKFQTLISTCLNCQNCRVACPVCYCKECVFATDVFIHPPELLIRRAMKKGALKMPTETTMFHLTRLAHMAHACVACGHCSSVCPSDIPVADFFITVGSKIQALFEYVPGRNVDEPIPYLVFEEKRDR
jgi:formate dehydrogenase (coenzyme F420) beta subunit